MNVHLPAAQQLRTEHAGEQVRETFEALADMVEGNRMYRDHLLGDQDRCALSDRLSLGQSPSSYIFSCSDSRVCAPRLFKAPPGRFFESRNVGNIIPADDQGLLAGVEYAVTALHVKHLIVLGHTGCGAIAGVFAGLNLKNTMPRTHRWVSNMAGLMQRVDEHYPAAQTDSEKLRAAAQENVLMQMERLHEDPLVKPLVAQGRLAVFGLVTEIDNHNLVSGWDAKKGCFTPFSSYPSFLLPRSP